MVNRPGGPTAVPTRRSTRARAQAAAAAAPVPSLVRAARLARVNADLVAARQELADAHAQSEAACRTQQAMSEEINRLLEDRQMLMDRMVEVDDEGVQLSGLVSQQYAEIGRLRRRVAELEVSSS
ncbi:hypothetical protein K488DRAFT_91324 [Vararia minispora EC-137]|uniref:Uncharacterized protein n=1 Tax=Vararia minispora EC-137 TaxID=1314806 RepID=A0ACB8Q652_9AGAM|nr:hypothetical protein K488DRAFT_91324 [Vararia minispora EC-137]